MEIRCNFCGWDNPEGVDICEKCHKPLHKENTESSSSFEKKMDDQATRRQCQNDISVLKATVNEQVSFEKNEQSEEAKKCPECGYILEEGICPNCGYNDSIRCDNEEVSAERSKTDKKVTVAPDRKEKKEGKKYRFVLTPISESGEPEGDLIDFSGSVVSLNRDNTDPENATITSQVQALISNKDGSWFIEDKSELKTTFVRAARETELKNGDFILLGNQLYRFDDITY